MAIFVPRFLRQLRDVLLSSPADGEVLAYDDADGKWKNSASAGGGVTDHGALTGLADDDHPQYTTTAEAQALVDVHVSDAADAHDASAVSVVPFGTIAATQVQAALEEIVGEAVSDLGPAVILAPASSARNVIQPSAGAVIAAIVKAHAAQSVDLTQWQDSGGVVLGSVSELGVVTISPGAGGVGLTIIPADYYGEFDPVNRGGFALTYPADPASSPPAITGYASLASGTYAPGTYPADRVMGTLTLYSQNSGDIGNTTGYVNLDGNGVISIVPYGYANVPALRVYDNDANYTFQVSSKGAVAIKTVDVAAGVPFSVGIGALNPYAWWVSAGGHEVLRKQVTALDADVGTSERWQWYDDTIGVTKLRFKQRDSAGTLVTGVSASEAYVDAIKLDDLAAPDDNTDLNVSTTKHGLTPKLSNVATEYLSGTGAFSTPSGSGIPSTIVDVKGDLIAASAADTVARLPVGTDTHVLTADSAQALGIKWAAAAGGGIAATLYDANTILKADTDDTPVALTMGASTILARLAAGSIKAATPAEIRTLLDVVSMLAPRSTYYVTPVGSAITTGTLATGYIYAVPILFSAAFTADRIGLEVTTAGSAGALLRLGIYTDDGQTHPGALVLDAGTIAADSTGFKEITISQAITPGIYWLVAEPSVASSTARCTNIVAMIGSATSASLTGNHLAAYYKGGGNTGALPATWAAAAGTVANQTNSGAPRILVRRT